MLCFFFLNDFMQGTGRVIKALYHPYSVDRSGT